MADIAVYSVLQLVSSTVSYQLSSMSNTETGSKEDAPRLDIDSIKEWLATMKACLQDSDGYEGNAQFQNSLRQIRDVAYDIGDALEEYAFHFPSHTHQHKLGEVGHGLWHGPSQRKALKELSLKTKAIKSRADGLLKLQQDILAATRGSTGGGPLTPSTVSDPAPEGYSSGGHGPGERDEIVGFLSTREWLIEKLLSGDGSCLTVFITGPSGSGKTVLARDVYEDPSVKQHFDCSAWILVTPALDSASSRMARVHIYRDGIGESPLKLDAKELALLRDRLNYLMDRKYIVILDNVWSDQEWKLIKETLPSGSLGSRIVVTSRNKQVDSSCSGESRDHVHEMDALSGTESWNLFCRKAFGSYKGDCPGPLRDCAEKLVKKCEGLPRAISAVGCLLAQKRSQIPSDWKEFHDNLGRNRSILGRMYPSFRDLRIHSAALKSCFLYFSVFPEDYTISGQELIRLWIAERFLDGDGENRGKEILKELVEMNLVHVSEWDSNRRVRSCRVRNLVRDLVICKAGEEKFAEVISISRSEHTTVWDCIGSSPCSSSASGWDHGRVRRLSLITDKTKDPPTPGNDLAWPPLGKPLPHVRSAFLFCKGISLNLGVFMLLRVLNMKGAENLRDFPEGIRGLHLLRFLSLQDTEVRSIPRWIDELSYLETLDVKQTLITELPSNICKLHKLWHLLVSYRYQKDKYGMYDEEKGFTISSFRIKAGIRDGIGALSGLHKLSLIKADDKILKELSKLVNLRKLGIVGLKAKDGEKLCQSLQKMPHLSTLDVRASKEEDYFDLDSEDPGLKDLNHLYLKGRLIKKLPGWISNLTSLVKIGLMRSRLESNPLEPVQGLPNLMELHLVDTYTGESLVFKRNTFQCLKVLTIEYLNRLNKVTVEIGAMPGLETLKVGNCESMRIPPLGIEHLRLKKVVTYDMHEDFNVRLQSGAYANVIDISRPSTHNS